MKTLLIAMAFTFPSSPQIEDGEDPCISTRKIDTYLSQMEFAFRYIDINLSADTIKTLMGELAKTNFDTKLENSYTLEIRIRRKGA
jgi:hypothetical protein